MLFKFKIKHAETKLNKNNVVTLLNKINVFRDWFENIPPLLTENSAIVMGNKA